MKREQKQKVPFLKSVRAVFRTVRVIFRLDWRNIPSFVLSQVFVTIQPFAALFFSARILDALTTGAPWETVLNWVLGAVTCTYGLYLLERLATSVSAVEGIDLYWRLYQEMSRVMMKADYEELEKPEIGLAVERIERATRMFWYGPWEVPGVLMSFAQGLTITLSALALAWPVFTPAPGGGIPWETILMVAFLIVSAVYSIYSETKLYRMKEENITVLAAPLRLQNFLFNYAHVSRAAKDIRLYAMQDRLSGLMEKTDRKVEELSDARAKLRSFSGGVRGALSQAITCLAYLAVGVRALAGLLTVGSIVQVAGAVTQLAEGVRVLVYSVQHIRMQGPHCQEYLDFIGEGDDPNQYRHQKDGTLPVDLSGDWEIVCENVGFRYPGAKEWALRGLNLRLKQGTHYALVGRNGSGKTTFVKLLCRLYDPTEGRILLNGRDVREYRRDELRRLFAGVFQDFQILALPLGQNVAAASHYDEARVKDCLRQAGALEWAEKQPQGLNQPLYEVEEGGVNLSGGEAQKLAIARALYKNAPFVILDEPTAALDPIAESEVYTRFRSMVDQKGALYISHRLSSCRFCDEIAVFEEGKLVQLGSHEALLGQEEGAYARLWHAQAQWYQA